MSIEEEYCAITTEPLTDANRYILTCGHKFDREAIHKWFKCSASCPTCRTPVETETGAVVNPRWLNEIVQFVWTPPVQVASVEGRRSSQPRPRPRSRLQLFVVTQEQFDILSNIRYRKWDRFRRADPVRGLPQIGLSPAERLILKRAVRTPSKSILRGRIHGGYMCIDPRYLEVVQSFVGGVPIVPVPVRRRVITVY
jgi:hypothetical protein